jgi:hypothetical protein
LCISVQKYLKYKWGRIDLGPEELPDRNNSKTFDCNKANIAQWNPIRKVQKLPTERYKMWYCNALFSLKHTFCQNHTVIFTRKFLFHPETKWRTQYWHYCKQIMKSNLQILNRRQIKSNISKLNRLFDFYLFRRDLLIFKRAIRITHRLWIFVVIR